MKQVLEITKLSYTYDETSEVLKKISFSIGPGEKIGLIGANGAGKSTLLHLIAGILLPQEGEIKVMERRLEKASLTEVRKQLGYVFQNPEDQLFMPTVFDDLSFGLKHAQIDPDEIEKRVDQVLKIFEIGHLKHRSNLKLSGGEKRTVALAVAMMHQPKLVILDEPTAALDPKARRHLIGQLNQQQEAMLIASHDLDFIWDTCHKVMVLHEGQILAMDETEVVLKQAELLEKAHLELPLRLQNCPNCQRGGE